MRYSALGVLASLTEEEVKLINLEEEIDLSKELHYLSEHVENVPCGERQVKIDNIIARICIDKAMSRHVGKMEEAYTPMGMLYNQYGKDLSKINYVIGTGGVLVHNANPANVLKAVEYKTKNGLELRPRTPRYLLDKDYLLASMGLLAEIDPLLALKIMKKHIVAV